MVTRAAHPWKIVSNSLAPRAVDDGGMQRPWARLLAVRLDAALRQLDRASWRELMLPAAKEQP